MVAKTAIAPELSDKKPRCPECGSIKIQRAGKVMLRSGERQRLKCTECGRVFYEEKG